MTDKLLSALYEERKATAEKLNKIDALILSCGGKIPGSSIPDTKTTSSTYSTTKTWKQKIIYALGELGKPSTAIEVTEFLLSIDPDKGRRLTHKNVTLNTSGMGVSGEIGVRTGDGENKYFLKS